MRPWLIRDLTSQPDDKWWTEYHRLSKVPPREVLRFTLARAVAKGYLRELAP